VNAPASADGALVLPRRCPKPVRPGALAAAALEDKAAN
jgi:hypothetical protein